MSHLSGGRRRASLWISVGLFVAIMGSSCASLSRTRDPLKNFDYVWKTFHRRYAFFRLRGVNWRKARARYRSMLTRRSSQRKLYRVLRKMLDQLRDAHVTLEAPSSITRGYKPAFDPDPYHWRKLRRVGWRVARRHTRSLRSYAYGKIRWGMLKGANVGYLQVNTLERLVHCRDLRRLRPGLLCGWWTYQSTAVHVVMRQVMKDLRRAKHVVLDLRFNTGGYDYLGRIILGYFIHKRVWVYSKQTRYSWGYSRKRRFALYPASRRRKGKLVILMSPVTASAAEVLLLSTMQLPHVRCIGSRTRGIFSDMLEQRMPNGWTFTLSHQVYRDRRGKNYEGKGIPPDTTIQYPAGRPKAFFRTILRRLRRGNDAVARAKSYLKPKTKATARSRHARK